MCAHNLYIHTTSQSVWAGCSEDAEAISYM